MPFALFFWFYFYLGLPILGRVSAIARHATMWARNSPSPSSMRDRPPHQDQVPYSLQTVCRFLNVPQNCLNLQGFWDGSYGLSSLSEKTRKSNCFQMSLQRQHFPLSNLKTLCVGPTGVGTNGLVDWRLINWAYQAEFGTCWEWRSFIVWTFNACKSVGQDRPY